MSLNQPNARSLRAKQDWWDRLGTYAKVQGIAANRAIVQLVTAQLDHLEAQASRPSRQPRPAPPPPPPKIQAEKPGRPVVKPLDTAPGWMRRGWQGGGWR